ncbi:SDR family NAD(P)-dependent oxidoreductase [Shinella sp. S4-D37]|uniref:SDR family NAD(P)-dependent oxidoreductase n=1 Tax=Shinella sp. S4-D37 TaxID=3161999 RepID=UPI003466974D
MTGVSTDGMQAEGMDERVAVIGLAGRFPGAPDVRAFWKMLAAGASGLTQVAVGRPDVVGARFALADKECFDAAFFGFAPSEAALMDPQQRVFLETAWHAMEDAGYGAGDGDRVTGVFAAAGFGDYVLRHVGLRSYADSAADYFAMLIGNDKDFLASRVAYLLDLKGPAVVVQSACSSGLLAVHQAVQSLLSREIDMALAGAVSISMDIEEGYHADPGGPMSPTGQIAPFSAGANGIVGGNGVAALVLKRLGEAERDGDFIYAVIEASAANNDGRARGNFTAPGIAGQKQVLSEALGLSGLSPDDVSYIEAHGTGTRIGDPIEMEAIRAVYGDSDAPCLIGSVKANTGHLNTVAGLAGLIKAIGVVHTGLVPPTINFTTVNPLLELAGSRFSICDRPTPLPSAERHVAAVSSFGFGGTNVHMLLASPPRRAAPATNGETPTLLCWSARTPGDLMAMEQSLATAWAVDSSANLADQAGTLLFGRKHFPHRGALTARNPTEALHKLRAGAAINTMATAPGQSIFLFPGQGTQFAGMGRPFYEALPVYRETLDRCAALIEPMLGQDIRPLLFGADDGALTPTLITQFSLFATEYALARSLMAAGLTPAALLGHSIGEYVAACLAGVFSLEDALRLVHARARLMSNLPPAAMLSIHADMDALAPYLGDNVSLAVVNRRDRCVVSGAAEALKTLAENLAAKGIATRLLAVSHGFHSHLMEPILEDFAVACRTVAFTAPKIPVLSNASGDVAVATDIATADYWVRHLRQTVRFSEDVATLARLWPGATCLELGPGISCAAAVTGAAAGLRALPTLASNTSQAEDLLSALGQLWMEGHDVDPDLLLLNRTWQRTPMPVYPFQRVVHLLPKVEPGRETMAKRPRRLPPDEWFHAPQWRTLALPKPSSTPERRPRLLFMPEGKMGLANPDDIRVYPGEHYAALPDGGFRVRPGHAGDFSKLTDALQARGVESGTCLFGWLMDEKADARTHGHDSLVRVVQAFAPSRLLSHLVLCTRTLAMLCGDETPDAEQALALGVLRAIPFEQPDLRATWLDADQFPGQADLDRLETTQAADASLHADAFGLRRGRFWRRDVSQVRLPPAALADAIRPGGTYLVAGGNGGLGRRLVQALAADGRHVAVIARSLDEDAPHFAECRRNGGRLTLVLGSAADRDVLRSVVARLDAAGERLDGIFNLAGRYISQTIADMTLAETDGNRVAKVETTRALLDVFGPMKPDFLVAFSSLAGETSGYGNSDYMGGNLFLDFLAEHPAPAMRLVTIGWDNWQDGAFGAANEQALFTDATANAIGIEEGLAALWQVIASGLPHVIVTPRDLQDRLRETSEAARQRLKRSTTFAEPAVVAADTGSPQERAVRLLFAQTLGLSGVAPSDDFLQLGGDSILAVRLLSKLRRIFQVEFGLPDFLANRTAALLSRRLETVVGTDQVALAYLHIHALPDAERQALARRVAKA